MGMQTPPPGRGEATSEQFEQQIRVASALRPLLVPGIVLALLSWFALALLFNVAIPAVAPYGNLLAALVAAGLLALLVRIRVGMLRRAAGRGRLVVDGVGLHAEYEGIVRSLAWQDIERYGKIRVSVPEARALTDSTRGVIAAMNLASRATAPSAPGVVGPGHWQEASTTAIGRQLMELSRSQHGVAEDGRIRVPIWFTDYGPEAQARLHDLLAAHRPDLARAATGMKET